MGVTKNVTACSAQMIAAPPVQVLKVATATMSAPATSLHTKTPPLSKAAVTAPETQAVQVFGGISNQGGSDLRFKATGEIYEDQMVTSMARIMIPSIGPIQQASVSGDVTLEIYNITSEYPDEPISATTSTTASASIFNAFQLDTRWTADTVGYNFKHAYTPDTGVLEGGNTYRFEYKINTVADGVLYVVTEVAVRGVFSA